MPPIAKYTGWSLDIDGVNAPIEPSSLQAENEFRKDEIRTGKQLQPEVIVTLGKRPSIKATLLDPSLVSDWLHFDENSDGVTSFWRAYDENGGLSTTFRSIKLNQGVILPVSLSANQNEKAKLDIMAVGRWNGGATPVVIGTATGTSATVAAAYYPKNLILGVSTITALVSLSANWNFNVQDDDQAEPEYYYYDERSMSGSAVVKDIAELTASRFVDSATETTVTLTLEDRLGSGPDVQVALGTCRITAAISGDEATISFESFGN